jgi:hypothetical protein
VKRGGTLVTVRAADATQAANAETIMSRHQPVSLRERGEVFRSGGWDRFDADSRTVTASEATSGTGHMDDRLTSTEMAPHGETDPTKSGSTRTTLDGRV